MKCLSILGICVLPVRWDTGGPTDGRVLSGLWSSRFGLKLHHLSPTRDCHGRVRVTCRPHEGVTSGSRARPSRHVGAASLPLSQRAAALLRRLLAGPPGEDPMQGP